MFTPKVMVIRMSKMVHFMYFLLNTEKKKKIWARYLNPSESFTQNFTKYKALQNTMDYVVLTYH